MKLKVKLKFFMCHTANDGNIRYIYMSVVNCFELYYFYNLLFILHFSY